MRLCIWSAPYPIFETIHVFMVADLLRKLSVPHMDSYRGPQHPWAIHERPDIPYPILYLTVPAS